jgi:hypothetical protein
MPFFLFCDTLMIGSATLVWLARDPLSVVPLYDGLIAIFLGLHALLLLVALRERMKLEIVWFSPRRMTNALALGLGALILAKAYLAYPALAGIERWEVASPGPISHFHRLDLALFPPTRTPSAYGGPEMSEALASVYAFGMLGPWAIGGLGLSALCFGLLTLELERPGAREMAVLMGATGYAFLFLGESLAVAEASRRNPFPLIVAQMADRFLLGVAAGYIFLATRHLLGAGLALGLGEWAGRYLVDEASSTRFAPLFTVEAPNQYRYWAVRLIFAAMAAGFAAWMCHQTREFKDASRAAKRLRRKKKSQRPAEALRQG